MISIDGLRDFGADADSALKRCMNNEEFYLKQVNKVLTGNSYDKIKEAVVNADLDAAFEAAHALKGVLGNLGLTPLYEPVAEMTECLRSKTDKDYSAYIDVIEDRVNALNNM
ncbi:MAG: Hpt domain-containing protein [Lachnospiraceae bacterium]|nr:Hpt domain-containing protein [Lachnospiraceae bacterium]